MSGLLEKVRRVHFVGVGGIGMSGIAELMVNLGYEVSGSDMHRTDITDRLESLGARISQGHDARNVAGAELVVYSSAVRPSNPEIAAARERGVAVVPRAELLAELMRLRQGIAVAGAHGKTTTTSMIALVLDIAGLDPTAVIGGRVSTFGSNARLGRGQYLVAEADESDRSFLKLSPRFVVITNIDREHLEAYRDFDDLKQAFVQFANGVPASGVVILCNDDAHLRELRREIKRHVVTYGFDETADVTATNVQYKGFGSVCTVRARKPGGRALDLGSLELSIPGRHNVLNALAAVAMSRELGIAWRDIARALAGFHGAERRFQRRGIARGVAVVEDYGHHPTEIAAVIAAAKPIADGRLIVAFQPHRFSRTQFLMRDFGPAFAGADVVVLTDIYAAGEDAIAGVSLETLASAVRADFTGELRVVPKVADVPKEIAAVARSRRSRRAAWRRIYRRRGASGSRRARGCELRCRSLHLRTSGIAGHTSSPRASARGLSCGDGARRDADGSWTGGLRGPARGCARRRARGLPRREHRRQGEPAPVHRRGARTDGRPRRPQHPCRGSRGVAARAVELSLGCRCVASQRLPSTIDVVILERTPLGIGRINGMLYLVDDRGTVIDEYGPNYADLDLPIIDGLSSAPGQEHSDVYRALLARRLLDALRVRNMADQISEIDVRDARNAVVLLEGDPTLIRLGSERFVERLQSYHELAPALREQVPAIDYVDLRFDERVYVGPGESSPRAALA